MKILALYKPDADNNGPPSPEKIERMGKFIDEMTKAGKLSVIPCHVGQIGPMIEAGIIPCDVAMIQVSPADAEGYHSFGLVGDHVVHGQQLPWKVADALQRGLLASGAIAARGGRKSRLRRNNCRRRRCCRRNSGCHGGSSFFVLS